MATPSCNDLLCSAKITFLISIEYLVVSRQDKNLEIFPCRYKLTHHVSLGLAISDFLFFLQLLIDPMIQTEILKVLCKLNLWSIKSKSYWISTVVMTVDSLSVLTCFSDFIDGFMPGGLGYFSLTFNEDGHFHQIFGILMNSSYCLNQLDGTRRYYRSPCCTSYISIFKNWLHVWY